MRDGVMVSMHGLELSMCLKSETSLNPQTVVAWHVCTNEIVPKWEAILPYITA